MRLPRVRFTVERLMVAVAIVASILAVSPIAAEWVRGSLWYQQMLRYQQMAAYCSKSEATYQSYERRYLTVLQDLESGLRPRDDLALISASPMVERDFAREGAAQNRAVAERWGRLKGVYFRASWLPWVDLSDSLQHPSWEDALEPYDDGRF